MIRTIAQPKCPVCNTAGVYLYGKLTDELFQSEGTWSMKRCNALDCGTLWLDPTPLPDDLKILYNTYSTHVRPPQEKSVSKKTFLDRVREAIWYRTLGYPTKNSSITTWWYNFISFLHPAWRDTQQAMLFYLPYKAGGRLLDIGCGNGSSMQIMKTHGWMVEGIDFDEKSIAQANENGLTSAVGELHDFHYPDNSFDAIMTNHVIEHIPQLESFLRECLRILKPESTLIAITPNADSLGHLRFEQDWRGLEVPRHLQIFTSPSLFLLADKTGFTHIESFTSTQGILQIYDESAYRKKHGIPLLTLSSTANRIRFHRRWFFAGWRHYFLPKLSEVAVLRCQK